MKTSLTALGGICSILLGVFSGVAGLLYFLIPADQRLGVPGSVLLPSYIQAPTMLNLENLALGLVGLLGLAVVPAVAQAMGMGDRGLIRWSSNLANVGFAVSAVGSFMILSRLPVIAAAYQKGDASTQAALAALWRTTLDPLGVWGYAAVGFWVLVVSIGLKESLSKHFSSTFSSVGIATGVAYWLVPLAFLVHVPALFLVVAGVGGILIVVWYVMLGLNLRRL